MDQQHWDWYTGATVNQQPSSVTDLNTDQHHTLDPVNIVTEQPSIMPREVMQSKIKKIYKPVLFVSIHSLCVAA